jgi:hydrogenase nickel incorporation protein HypB
MAERKTIPILKDVTDANALLAAQLRQRVAQARLLAVNVIASPGAGKTTLLERTIEGLAGELRLGVIEGDPYTDLDAARVAAVGAGAVQINTMGGCHLEARMIQNALQELDLGDVDLLIIENVGNLVCPTGWDLGEDLKVVVASLAEGDDKPLKYPMAFTNAQAVVINKVDLEPHIPATAARMRQNALTINPNLAVFEVSATSGQGVDAWLAWLRERLDEKREAVAADGTE